MAMMMMHSLAAGQTQSLEELLLLPIQFPRIFWLTEMQQGMDAAVAEGEREKLCRTSESKSVVISLVRNS